MEVNIIKNKKFKPNGFTLIELLAVIIILAIVALIAIPIILNVIEDSRKSANKSQVELLLGGAEQYYANGLLNDKEFNGLVNIYDNIETTNEKPEHGNIKIDSDGKISLAIYLDGICYTKGFNDKEISEDNQISDPEECVPFELPIGTEYDYTVSNNIQEFIALQDGYYFFEAWGASSNNASTYGSYTAGTIYLMKNDIVYVNVGNKNTTIGETTDFRLNNENPTEIESLNSRIMIAQGIGSETSYISGHTGTVSVKSESDSSLKDGCIVGNTDINCSLHYSGKRFFETSYIDGTGYYWTNEKQQLTVMPDILDDYYLPTRGHSGDGHAKITYMGIEMKKPIYPEVTLFAYTGTAQEITLSQGTYKYVLAGAMGGTAIDQNKLTDDIGGKGAVVSGNISLNNTTTFYAHIGGRGGNGTYASGGAGGYNGGGKGGNDTDDEDAGGGGGATDIRLLSGTWNDSQGLNSRIIVAAGGSGGQANAHNAIGSPGGALKTIAFGGGLSEINLKYQFGIGQPGNPNYPGTGVGGAGGGGGYFGGIGGNVQSYGLPGNGYIATGGTSYASGCTGCQSVTSQTDSTITDNNTHYSGFKFENITMEIGKNSGNGYIYIVKID